MASIERTAYPRFKRTVTAHELHDSFTPSVGEIEWARELTRSAEHLLALVVLLKSFQRLGYFADLCEVPVVVVDHNDPEHLEKLVKFNELLANCMIYNTTVDLTNLVNELVADGHPVRRGDLATISPYITSKTRRFGDWALVLDPPNDQVARLNLPADDDDEQEAV